MLLTTERLLPHETFYDDLDLDVGFPLACLADALAHGGFLLPGVVEVLDQPRRNDTLKV